LIGKEILWFHTVIWQAMLLSAGFTVDQLPKKVYIHSFYMIDGQKMSKSVGNVVDPFDIIDRLVEKGVVEEQAIDALRYWFAREMSTSEDGDFTWEKFVESYTANLANGLGNLVSRVLKMAANASIVSVKEREATLDSVFCEYLRVYEIQKAADWIWDRLRYLDEYIAENEPFKTVKSNPEEGKKQIEYLLEQLTHVNCHLAVFLPDTSSKISEALSSISVDAIPRLFPRIE
jgi:methionyl-tRNA synthetase